MPFRRATSYSRRTLQTALLTSVSALTLLSAGSAMAGDILRGNRAASPVANVTAQQAAAMQAAQQAARRSANSLARATQAVQAMRQAQTAARNLALQAPSAVPNGLAPGGLVVAPGATPGTELWQGAEAPTQSQSGGQTQVDIKQTQQKAILTWEKFNVGKDTTVHFDQTKGRETDGSNNWIALNRINDPSGRPSEIRGKIKA
jgi:filamentous hemagglutinin